MKTAQATKQAASCVPPHLFRSCESQDTMSCLCLRLWKMCLVHKGHCSCFPLQDLLTCKNHSFVSFLSYTPSLFLSEWTCQLTQECTAYFSPAYLEVFWGKAKDSAIHSTISKRSMQTLVFHLFIAERFQRDHSCLMITHPWNLARGRFPHSGDNLKPWISCLLRKRWGTIVGNSFVGLQNKDSPPTPWTSHFSSSTSYASPI